MWAEIEEVVVVVMGGGGLSVDGDIPNKIRSYRNDNV